MNKLFRRLRDLFFFLSGLSVGVTGIVGAIYIYVLKEDAKGNSRPRYRDYSRRPSTTEEHV